MKRTIDEIFNDRTCYHFTDQPIEHNLLTEMYDLMKLGPTSANSCPLRIVFVETSEAKERLSTCVMPGNADKIKMAPVTALFAYDMKFYDKIPYLFPHMPAMKDYFSGSAEVTMHTATLNSALQAAYFMMIARGRGLGCTPMSGFNMEAVNKEFLSETDYKISLICSLGYRSTKEDHPRMPRLSFEEVCTII
ncbi:MAG: malonic semialdehyde reductase [Pseudomonadota bacterium]